MGNRITFTGSQGEELAARLDLPPTQPKAYVLFAHCFTCGKDLNAVNRIARALNKEDIALFRFDFTGLGASNGDFANTNFSSNVQDLIKAYEFLDENYQAPKIAVGHSLGGTAVLTAAEHMPKVKAVATIGSPFDAEHVVHNFSCAIGEIEENGIAEVDLQGRQFTIKKQFLDDVRNQSVAAAIQSLDKALLVMHSPIDKTVDIENARKIYDHAKHPKSFVSLDNADHLLMKKSEDSIYAAKILSAWASRYVA